MSWMEFVSSVCCVFYFVLFCVDFSVTFNELAESSDHICFHSENFQIKLFRGKLSSYVVKEQERFDRETGRHGFDCKFVVKGDHGDGVIAVIQQLSFRPAYAVSDEEPDRCVDFVQFKGDDGTSKKYCDNINIYSPNFEEEGKSNNQKVESGEMLELSENAFYDPGGKMEVRIYLNNKPVFPSSINIVIAFTSYVECHKSIRNYSSCGTDICIWDGLFGNGIVNCPYNNCQDETGLCRPSAVSKRGLSSKVTVGAVATIFLSFLLFFVCLWLARRHSLLCWSRDCAGRQAPDPRVEMRPQHDPVHALSPDDEGTVQPPSAPPETHVEKDLPPSYTSLFPDK